MASRTAALRDGRDPAAIEDAARRLEAGELVAFPCETVYGLGADARNPEAVAAIFEAKGRPQDNPLIVHVSGPEAAQRWAAAWPPAAAALAQAFWPGPLTLVLPVSPEIPSAVTAGGPTIALRAPDHAVAQALLAAFGGPIAAPSANRSTSISPTTAAHVQAELGSRIPLILDGGPCAVGLESTVLDISGPPAILRPGQVGAAAIEAVLGFPLSQASPAEGAARSPGQRHRHYAPRTTVQLGGARPAGSVALALGAAPAPARRMPSDSEGYARALYAALRWADAQGGASIWIEPPPQGPAWAAVWDRLRRAAEAPPPA